MWPFSDRKPLFSPEENERIVEAIRDAERQTSGEVRLFVENRCKYVDPLDRAKEIFTNLKMEETEFRNGVLFYVALGDKQLAVFADQGIHEATGSEYWKNLVHDILSVFSKNDIVGGITTTILSIGQALKSHFPYEMKMDKNELPDEIIFGA
ncbi:MAG: TPM domain-containing protein [Ginsengibacter sp.]